VNRRYAETPYGVGTLAPETIVSEMRRALSCSPAAIRCCAKTVNGKRRRICLDSLDALTAAINAAKAQWAAAGSAHELAGHEEL